MKYIDESEKRDIQHAYSGVYRVIKKNIPSFRDHKSVIHLAILIKFYTHTGWAKKNGQFFLRAWMRLLIELKYI